MKYRKLLWVAFLFDVFDRVLGDVVMWEGVVVPIVQCFAQIVVLPPPVDDDRGGHDRVVLVILVPVPLPQSWASSSWLHLLSIPHDPLQV